MTMTSCMYSVQVSTTLHMYYTLLHVYYRNVLQVRLMTMTSRVTCVLQVGEDGRVPMCEMMYGWALRPKTEVEAIVTEPVEQPKPGINTHAVIIVIRTGTDGNYRCIAT